MMAVFIIDGPKGAPHCSASMVIKPKLKAVAQSPRDSVAR